LSHNDLAIFAATAEQTLFALDVFNPAEILAMREEADNMTRSEVDAMLVDLGLTLCN
tara:strand:- start:21162 stop:21332 length:171 start_codon:yes stop_codon:yes gene_type:complete